MTHHLAQVNIARLKAPIDDPLLSDFVAQLDGINALAERSPGFVWRLQSDEGDAVDIVFNDDPLVIVNMSVWESVESLRDYAYASQHVDVFRRRAEWFERPTRPHYCLWWAPVGLLPSVADARERLEHYQTHGATPYSFWFSKLYPAPQLAAR